jgi:hypothetical protein
MLHVDTLVTASTSNISNPPRRVKPSIAVRGLFFARPGLENSEQVAAETAFQVSHRPRPPVPATLPTRNLKATELQLISHQSTETLKAFMIEEVSAVGL